MGADMNLDGMEQLLNALHQRSQNADKVERKAVRAGAEVVRKRIAQNAPRDPKSSDHLGDHITMSGVKEKDGVKTVEVGPARGDNGKYFYGKFVEFGTLKMAARPFAGPSLDESKGEAVDAMMHVIKKELGL